MASSTFSAAVAAQETLVDLVSEGVKVETAGDELELGPACAEAQTVDPGPAQAKTEPEVVDQVAWPFPTEKQAA
ncbi:MAG: hypothetical protein IPJ61_18470 [Tessaracoccus sp.]|uniref:hypothetical protein n=1 Tax=Tessaracoccus sp. TaxID=1971211 RepID=UPI001ECAE96B|nr:hypothetical protein [Tessaracoccus sp.]MBK7822970.1 hypothetical protein [Tessaracoccus sp.]